MSMGGKKSRLTAKILFVLSLYISVGLFLAPAPAKATGMPVTDVGNTLVNSGKWVWDKIQSAATFAWDHGAAIAYRNAVKYFAQQVAYDTAVWLGSGGKGQQPAFVTDGWGTYLGNVGKDAAGEFIDSLDEANPYGKLGLCAPAGPGGGLSGGGGFKLIIGTTLFREIKPSPPNCTWAKLIGNWEKALAKPETFLTRFQAVLQPNQNDLGIALELQSSFFKKQEDQKTANALLLQAGEGLKQMGDSIADTVKSSLPRIKASSILPINLSGNELASATGDAIADGVQIFTNTLAARLMKRITEKGDVPNPSRYNSSKFGFSGSNIDYAIQVNSSISTAQFLGGGVLDVISEFSDCPDKPEYAPPNNCTLNDGLTRVLREAQGGNPLTIGQALYEKRLLNPSWTFKRVRPAGIREPQYWYLSDIKKLRKARILPVGWEMAASMFGDSSVSLGDVVGHPEQNYADGFNAVDSKGGCNQSTTPPSDFSGTWKPAGKYCHLIDPNWILRAPPAQCRLSAYTAQLEPEGSNRQKECVDTQNCVAEAADGTCQAWGYCTQEKNIWRFVGDSCEFPQGSGYSPFATCKTLTSTSNNQVSSYLQNSLQGLNDATCNNIQSCQWYSPDYNFPALTLDCRKEENRTACSKQYLDAVSNRMYLKNPSNFNCDQASEGCHAYYRVNNINNSAVQDADVSAVTTLDCTDPANELACQVNKVVAKVQQGNMSYQSLATIQQVTLKQAPSYLQCDGANPPAECNKYLKSCRAAEVGCEEYRPVDGSPSVPAILSTTDTCDARCVGYNVYDQTPSYFEPVATTVKFVPTTGKLCMATQAGCEEFTNIQVGEQKEYFSQLRQCILPSDTDAGGASLSHTYYTWVGSNLTGYQLQTWKLQAEDPANENSGPKTTDDSSGGTKCGTGGHDYFQGAFPESPDCKQFYDTKGQVHYRFASKTITAATDCTQYRSSNVGESACSATGGEWRPSATGNACYYRAIPSQGKRCTATYNGCREYRGPTAGNVRTVFLSTFDTKTPGASVNNTGWAGGTPTSESAQAFGQSYQVNVNSGKATSSKGVGKVLPGKKYVLFVWAKAQSAVATLEVQFSQTRNGNTQVSSFEAITEVGLDWVQYRTSLVAPNDWGDQSTTLSLSSNDAYFVDNVFLQEVADTSFIIKNSWRNPRDAEGNDICINQPSCQLYKARDGQQVALKSFSKICRAEAVGCEALVDTQNSLLTAGATTINVEWASGATAYTTPVDNVVYRVYDEKKQCSSSAKACTRLGAPNLSAEGVVKSWKDTYAIVDPDKLAGPIQSDGTFGTNDNGPFCTAAQNKCQEFTDGNGAKVYFKAPGEQVCEYKRLNSQTSYAWYKKGTTQLCNLLKNGSFEESKKMDDGTSSFIAWSAWGSPDESHASRAGASRLIARPSINSTKDQYWGGTALEVEGVGIKGDGVPTGLTNDDIRLYAAYAQVYLPEALSSGTVYIVLQCHDGEDYQNCGNVNPNEEVQLTASSPVGQWKLLRYLAWAKGSRDTSTEKLRVVLVGPRDQRFYADDVQLVQLTAGSTALNEQARVGRQYAADALPYAQICPSEQSGCTAFHEPNLTNQTYYYKKNDKLDTKSCTGVSDKNGCVLFNDFSQGATANSAFSYTSSRAQQNKEVGPIASYCDNKPTQGCSTDADCAGGQCIKGTLDSNTILKVSRDRVCSEWLSCQSESTRFINGKPQTICYALGKCNAWGQGGVGQCANWLPNNPAETKVLTSDNYQNRPVEWGAPEFSGYSIPGIYPIESLTEKNYGNDEVRLTRFSAKLTCNGRVGGSVCTPFGSVCREGGSNGVCMYEDVGINGLGSGDLTNTTSKQCRAYPAADAPFPDKIVETWQPSCEDCPNTTNDIIEVPQTKVSPYQDSNACAKGENCECSYKQLTYTSSEPLFYGFNSSDWKQSYVVGYDDNASSNSMSKLKKIDYKIGVRGYCLEYDESRKVNKDESACLTWLPLDVVAGDLSVYDYSPNAGFSDVNVGYYCSKQGAYHKIDSEKPFIWGGPVFENSSDETSADTNYRRSFKLPDNWPPIYKHMIQYLEYTVRTTALECSITNRVIDVSRLADSRHNDSNFCVVASVGAQSCHLENTTTNDGNSDNSSPAEEHCRFVNNGNVFFNDASWDAVGNTADNEKYYGRGGDSPNYYTAAASAIFDGPGPQAKLLGFNVALGGTNGGLNGIKVALKDDICVEIAQVSDTIQNKAWTDRLLNPARNFRLEFDDSSLVLNSSEVSPKYFGYIPGFNAASDAYIAETKIERGTTQAYSCEQREGFNCGNATNASMCVSGNEQLMCTADSCGNNRACIGSDKIPPIKPDSKFGIRNIQQLFAKVYNTFKYGPTDDVKYIENNLDLTNDEKDISDSSDESIPPVVAQVSTDAAGNLKEGQPGFTLIGVGKEGNKYITKSNNAVTVQFYAYNPNGEQMPLRQVMVDWDSGTGSISGNVVGSYKNHKHICQSEKIKSTKACLNYGGIGGLANLGASCSSDKDCVKIDGTVAKDSCQAKVCKTGFLKGYFCTKDEGAPYQAGATNLSDGAGCEQPAGSGACVPVLNQPNPGYNFGDSPQACVDDSTGVGYFAFTHVYTCSGKEPTCITELDSGGCFDTSQNACRFKPGVLVKDNWDWCSNGSSCDLRDQSCKDQVYDCTANANSAGWHRSKGYLYVRP